MKHHESWRKLLTWKRESANMYDVEYGAKKMQKKVPRAGTNTIARLANL